MSFALNTLKQLLASENVSKSPQVLGVVIASSPAAVVVSTARGAATASSNGLLRVGDRVVVEGDTASAIYSEDHSIAV